MTSESASPGPAEPYRAIRRRRSNSRIKIASAALELFSREGFEFVTVDDIVTAASVSRATFYTQFRSKSDVLVEIWETSLNEGVSDVFLRFNELGPHPTHAGIREWMSAAVDYWASTKAISIISEQAIAMSDDVAVDLIRRTGSVVDGMTNYLDRWTPEAVGLARLRMEIHQLQLHYVCQLWLRGALRVSREELVTVLADSWWAMLSRDEFPGESDSAQRESTQRESTQR